MGSETIETQFVGEVAYVWLARPQVRNALNESVLLALEEVYREISASSSAKVVVLGGRGQGFCAGADRNCPPGAPPAAAATDDSAVRKLRWMSRLGSRVLAAIQECSAITVARLHGAVVGGGVGIALACDFRIASHDTRFWLPEVSFGVPFGWGAVPRLVSEVGAARARRILLLEQDLSVQQALEYGMIDYAFPEDELDRGVATIVDRLVKLPQFPVWATKDQLSATAATHATAMWDGDRSLLSRFVGDRAF